MNGYWVNKSIVEYEYQDINGNWVNKSIVEYKYNWPLYHKYQQEAAIRITMKHELTIF